MHYPGDQASHWEHGDAIEFQDLGDAASAIYAK
jgi:hypothetical protein